MESTASPDQALRELETLYWAAPFGLALLDRDCRFLRVNEKLAELAGLPAKAHVGRHVSDVLPELGPSLEPFLHRVLETGQPISDLDIAGTPSPTGTGEYIVEQLYPVTAEDGILAAIGVIVREVSGHKRAKGSESDLPERRDADELLRMSEARLWRFIDAAPAAIAMLDRDMRYIAASRRFKLDFQLENQELVGRWHYDVFPEIPQHWRDVHQRCLQGAVESSAGERFVRTDGTVNWVRWEVQPWYDTPEKIGGIILFTEDVTERKEAEESVRFAVADAERANREKEDFLLAVSHDIRQPLQTLSFLQDVLAKKTLDPEMSEVLARQAGTVSAMAEALNTLLHFDRLERGAVEPRLTDVSLREMLERLRDEFEDRARAKLLTFRCVSTSLVARTDAVLLSRVLRNLLSNALKYTKAGSVLIGCRRRGTVVRIEVWDTGIGIPADETELIFEKHRQGNMEANQQGFGLGLSLVRHLCRLLGHQVEVSSAFGKGSVFAVSLPFSEHPPGAPEPPAGVVAVIDSAAPKDDRGPDGESDESRVYMVDGDAGAREALAKLLDVHGLPVLAYPNAEAFLATYKPAPGQLECLLLDVMLPEMTGLELLGILRQRRIDIPTIVVTGQRDMQIATQAVLLGAMDVIEKPARGEGVVRAVRRALDSAAQRRAMSRKSQEINALFQRLTPRERQVMALLVSGLANKEVAYRLSISERTVEVHRRAIMQKMTVKSFAGLVRAAAMLGFGSSSR